MDETYDTVRDDFFSRPRDQIGNVSLMGATCSDCGEVFLGAPSACQNCQSERLEYAPLSRDGVLYSYTVVRTSPPGDYKGQTDPFQPYPVGLVELPEGVRLLSVLDVEIDALKIGMSMTLSVFPLYENEAGKPVLSYRFQRAEGGR